MAYKRTVWKNREVERPRTYEKIENPDGTITLIPSEGTIIEEGTPITADIMNNIEDGIEEALIGLTKKVDKEEGKRLITDAEANKLAGIEAGAQKNTVTSVAGKTGAVTLSKSDVGLGNVDNVKQMPITGGTFTGIVTAQNNTSYTTKQIRNIILSTANPSGGANGDVWLKYKP